MLKLLEVVNRVSETQLQVTEKSKYNLAIKGLIPKGVFSLFIWLIETNISIGHENYIF